jgi:hypothetical protein
MDEKARRDKDNEGDRRHAANTDDEAKRDELARRRAENSERAALTKREREERWPVG